MTFPRVSLGCAALVMALSAPAAACDLHGPGQMAGFHRYNPFANTFVKSPNASKTAPDAAETEALAAKTKSARPDPDARRQERVLDAQETRGENLEEEARADTVEGQSALS